MRDHHGPIVIYLYFYGIFGLKIERRNLVASRAAKVKFFQSFYQYTGLKILNKFTLVINNK